MAKKKKTLQKSSKLPASKSGLTWGAATKEKPGEWDGLNNAAIYTFKSDIINSLVREMFQNSIDARDRSLPKDKKTKKIPPLKIKITYKELTHDQFPDSDGFYQILKKIADASPNKQHEKFFENAFVAFNKNKPIPFFIFEDYNTKGLEGKDEDPEKSFNSCVVSEGVSVKSEPTAGGSFGIGKNAIYGLSKLRTVFYSSYNKKNEFIFQGKAKLACYYDGNKTKDSKIYCGTGDSFSSLRNASKLPKDLATVFSRTQPGLSLYALCPVEHEDWANEYVKAILKNYWLILEKGELSVELYDGDTLKHQLSIDNLEEKLLEFFDPKTYERDEISPEGNPWEFYNCYKNGTCVTRDDFPLLQNVRFYYSELENKDTNRVAFLRNDMVVYSERIHGFSRIGYCGVFICENAHGNEILRAMEPPSHDAFKKDLLQDNRLGLSIGDGKRILESMKRLIRDELNKIVDRNTQPVEEISWLNELLSSSLGKGGSGAGQRTNTPSEKETTERLGKNIEKTIQFSSSSKNSFFTESEAGEPEEGGRRRPVPSNGHPHPADPPDDGFRPELEDPMGNYQNGDSAGPIRSKKTKIKSRVFRTNNSKSHDGKTYTAYRIILEASSPSGPSDLLLAQQGDSGQVGIFSVLEASASGQPVPFQEELKDNGDSKGYRLRSIQIPCVLDVFVHEPYKSSFRILKL